MNTTLQALAQSKWEDAQNVVEPQTRADGAHAWPFVPSLPVDVHNFTFERNRERRPTHHEYFELLYVHSGAAVYEIRDRRFRVGSSDLIVINGSLPHRLAEVAETPCNAVTLYFIPDLLRAASSSSEHVQYLMPFLMQEEMFPPLIPHTSHVPGEILNLILGIQQAIGSGTDRARLEVQTYLEMIMVLLINYYRDHLLVEDAFDRWQHSFNRFRPLFDFIGRHYREPISLARATEIVGMSKPHFMRSFKRLTGQSFDTYLNHYRVTKAQALLAATDLPIAAVGQEVGFSDQSYFGLTFRRMLQLTPRDYRKSLERR
jgi:AraC-like DNA-binding protein/mannose-6-phosphate isomerase-like protein (cupin superfamily)